MTDSLSIQPTHNPAASRFEALLPDGHYAVINYTREGDTLTIYHTGVPVAFEGRGIAAMLTRFALEWAKANQLRVHPICSYTRAYLQRHPEYQTD